MFILVQHRPTFDFEFVLFFFLCPFRYLSISISIRANASHRYWVKPLPAWRAVASSLEMTKLLAGRVGAPITVPRRNWGYERYDPPISTSMFNMHKKEDSVSLESFDMNAISLMKNWKRLFRSCCCCFDLASLLSPRSPFSFASFLFQDQERWWTAYGKALKPARPTLSRVTSVNN